MLYLQVISKSIENPDKIFKVNFKFEWYKMFNWMCVGDSVLFN